MPKLVFIRHAEPVREGYDFNRQLTKDGEDAANNYRKKNIGKFGLFDDVLTSHMKRSKQTADIIFGKSIKTRGRHAEFMFNEYNKNSETKENFIERVRNALDWLTKIMKEHKVNVVVVSHARWMTVAHQILKPNEIVLGFDFLERFEHEF